MTLNPNSNLNVENYSNYLPCLAITSFFYYLFVSILCKNNSYTIFLFFIYLTNQCNSSEVTDVCASCNASVADFVPYTA